jgi:hypothetical protein
MSYHRTPVSRTATAVPAGAIGSPQNNTNTAPAAPTNGTSHSMYTQKLWTRYSHLKDVEDAKNALIEDVLSRYDAVVRQCQTLIAEQDAQGSHRNGSINASAYQQQEAEWIAHLQGLLNGNPFVVVIVDGNNLLFNDSYIRDGEKGGRRAAIVLRDEISEWVPKCVEQAPTEFKILIKVYADFKGLSGTLKKGGIIESLSTFADFTRGFNTLFDFVDVGRGDVDSRIVGRSWSFESFIIASTT